MKKVLVVDDSETIRVEVSRALGQAGFSVLEARDGAEGLATAIKNPDLARYGRVPVEPRGRMLGLLLGISHGGLLVVASDPPGLSNPPALGWLSTGKG